MPTLLQLPAECLLAIITRLPVLDVVCMASCCSGKLGEGKAGGCSSAHAQRCAHNSSCLGLLNQQVMLAELHVLVFAALKQLAQDDCFWGGLAEAKWGTAVRDLKPLSEQQHQEAAGPSDDVRTEQQKDTEAAADGSWRRYCCKRMSARTIRWDRGLLSQGCIHALWAALHMHCCTYSEPSPPAHLCNV